MKEISWREIIGTRLIMFAVAGMLVCSTAPTIMVTCTDPVRINGTVTGKSIDRVALGRCLNTLNTLTIEDANGNAVRVTATEEYYSNTEIGDECTADVWYWPTGHVCATKVVED